MLERDGAGTDRVASLEHAESMSDVDCGAVDFGLRTGIDALLRISCAAARVCLT